MPPNTRQRVPGGPDWIGCILVTLGLTLFLIALSQGPVDGWRAGYVVAFLVVGLLLLPVFVAYEMWLERKKWTPMLRISNFRRGKFGLINLFGFFGFMSYACVDAVLAMTRRARFSVSWARVDFLPGLLHCQNLGLSGGHLLPQRAWS